MNFTGEISEDGKLTIINRKGFLEHIKTLSGKKVVINVVKKISQRSSPQNAYYWSCVIKLVSQGFKELGHDLTKEGVHEFLKNRFLKQEIINPNTGEYIGDRIRSTTELNKSEFADYIAEIQRFAAEYLNIYIPDPNTQTTINI